MVIVNKMVWYTIWITYKINIYLKYTVLKLIYLKALAELHLIKFYRKSNNIFRENSFC